jgi:lysophospholipase L1-like esterase
MPLQPNCMKNKPAHRLLVPLLLLLGWSAAWAAGQAPFVKWEKDIAAFEARDKTNPPPQKAILFAGSSSMRLWKTLPEDLPGYTIINRGFGGSQIFENTHFASRIAIPYKPRLIVLHAGSNDIAAGRTPEQVLADFKAYVQTIRAALPETRIAFVSINPTPRRWEQVEKQKRANALIKDYVASGKNLDYIDIFNPLLEPDGKPREDLHIADRLHPNHAGYKLRAELIRPHLGEPWTDGCGGSAESNTVN